MTLMAMKLLEKALMIIKIDNGASDRIVGQIDPNRDVNKDIDSSNDMDENFLLLFGMITKVMMGN